MTPPVSPVRLRPMRPDEFAAWRERFIRDWGEDLARHEDLSAADAVREAESRTDADLHQGLATRGHYVRVICDESGTLGAVWYSVGARGAFLDDLSVASEHRGRGVGQAALALVEAELRALGHAHLDLHVYADNAPAIALYRRSGYRTTGFKMRKSLAPR